MNNTVIPVDDTDISDSLSEIDLQLSHMVLKWSTDDCNLAPKVVVTPTSNGLSTSSHIPLEGKVLDFTLIRPMCESDSPSKIDLTPGVFRQN